MQVTRHIHAVKIPFQIIDNGHKIPRFVYSFIIFGRKICLVDSGVASSEQIILDYLKAAGRRPDEISMLVLTHSHPDHIGSARAIAAASGCLIASHSSEKTWIEDVDLQAKERPVPGFGSLVGGSVKVNAALEDGDSIDLGDGLALQVIHTPGHSIGSISLWFPEDGALFSGDAIPLAGEMPIYDDPVASVKSIKRLKEVSGIKVLLASWDEPVDGERAYRIMDESLLYLQRVHEAVIEVSNKRPGLELLESCKLVLRELGLPETMANPLVARSFQANFSVRNHENLMDE